MGRQQGVHGAGREFQKARSVVGHNGFARRNQVIAQDEVVWKAVRHREDEAQSVTTIIREEVKVGNGVLDTRFPERAGRVEFVDESCRDARGPCEELRRTLTGDCPTDAGNEGTM